MNRFVVYSTNFGFSEKSVLYKIKYVDDQYVWEVSRLEVPEVNCCVVATRNFMAVEVDLQSTFPKFSVSFHKFIMKQSAVETKSNTCATV